MIPFAEYNRRLFLALGVRNPTESLNSKTEEKEKRRKKKKNKKAKENEAISRSSDELITAYETSFSFDANVFPIGKVRQDFSTGESAERERERVKESGES